MTLYLISFNDGSMSIPAEEMPEVARAAHAVIDEARDAGVYVFGGGLHDPSETSVVATDGTISDGPTPLSRDFIGGFTVVDVPSRTATLTLT